MFDSAFVRFTLISSACAAMLCLSGPVLAGPDASAKKARPQNIIPPNMASTIVTPLRVSVINSR